MKIRIDLVELGYPDPQNKWEDLTERIKMDDAKVVYFFKQVNERGNKIGLSVDVTTDEALGFVFKVSYKDIRIATRKDILEVKDFIEKHIDMETDFSEMERFVLYYVPNANTVLMKKRIVLFVGQSWKLLHNIS
jgi:hypothetical protein